MDHLIKTLAYINRHRVITVIALIMAWITWMLVLKLTIAGFASSYNVPPAELPDEPFLATYGASLTAAALMFGTIIWFGGLIDREAKRGSRWAQRLHSEYA